MTEIYELARLYRMAVFHNQLILPLSGLVRILLQRGNTKAIAAVVELIVPETHVAENRCHGTDGTPAAVVSLYGLMYYQPTLVIDVRSHDLYLLSHYLLACLRELFCAIVRIRNAYFIAESACYLETFR